VTLTLPEVTAWPAPAMPELTVSDVDRMSVVIAPRPGARVLELRLVVPLVRGTVLQPGLRTALAAALTRATEPTGPTEDAWAAIGGGVTVRSTPTTLVISAHALPDALSAAIALLAEAVTQPAFPAEVVGQAAALALSAAQLAEEDDSVVLAAAGRAALLGHSPLARELPRRDEIADLTSTALAAAVLAHLGRDGSTLIVAGAVDAGVVRAQVADVFASWAGPDATPIGLRPRSLGGTVVVHRPGALQSSIGNVAPAPRRTDAGYPALALAVRVVGGTATSRMSERLRERRGYAYFANVFLDHDGGTPRVTARTAVESSVTAAAVHEVRYVLGRAAVSPFNDADVEAGSRGLAGRLTVDVHSVAGLAEHLSAMAAEGSPLDAQLRVAADVREVTSEQARSAAAASLAPARMTTVVVGDADVITPGLESLGEVRVVDSVEALAALADHRQV
jgi:predicted Zn-dependent peptidase